MVPLDTNWQRRKSTRSNFEDAYQSVTMLHRILEITYCQKFLSTTPFCTAVLLPQGGSYFVFNTAKRSVVLSNASRSR
jgi:hypothetical protein